MVSSPPVHKLKTEPSPYDDGDFFNPRSWLALTSARPILVSIDKDYADEGSLTLPQALAGPTPVAQR